MITTGDQYILEEANKVVFDGLSMLCVPTILDEDDLVNVDVRVLSGTQVVGGILLPFTNTEIEAFTASGTTDRDKFFNQCEQAVVDYLENITGNSGVTFTIA